MRVGVLCVCKQLLVSRYVICVPGYLRGVLCLCVDYVCFGVCLTSACVLRGLGDCAFVCACLPFVCVLFCMSL